MTQDNKNKQVNPVAIGVAGAIIGAVGSAVAIALSDKKNREVVEKKFQEVKVWGDKKMKDIKVNTHKSDQDAIKKVNEIEDEIGEDIKKDMKLDDDMSARDTSQVIK